MSVTNESRIRSWFQFSSKSSANSSTNNNNNSSGQTNGGNVCSARQTDDEISAAKDQSDGPSAQSSQTSSTSNTSILERVTSFRRSLGKAQNKKNKIRPSSVKGLTSGVVEQHSLTKSKSICARKTSSSPPTTSGAHSLDDDEIYGFTTANLESSNSSTRRQLKSSLQSTNASNAPNITNSSIAPNISHVYDSDQTNKSGRVRNEERDESHTTTASNTATTTTAANKLSKESPERLKADKEFPFHNQQQNQQSFDTREQMQNRHYFYKQQFFNDSDIGLRHSAAQHLSWVAPITSDTDDIDRIYENMRGLSSALASAQQRHRNANNLYANSVNNSSDIIVNHNNRKLTKDSGYESASVVSLSNWNGQNIANHSSAQSNSYFHSRSDSNASSVSTGGSLSPRTAANKSAYQYCDQWSAAKSTSNLPLQVQASINRRSSLTGPSHPYPESYVNPLPVLPAKSVPGNLDKDNDENVVKKRSHNRNNPTPSSVYSLLASKSGFDFAPHLKSSRKSCGPNFDTQFSKYSERFLPKKMDANGGQLWKTTDNRNINISYGPDHYDIDESPPPTPPVRDSSLSSNRKFNSNCESQEMESQNKLKNESSTKSHYHKNSHYYMKSYSESRVSHMGCSKSLINLRSNESSDLKQFSQTYPLLPETEFGNNSALTESWSCDQSVTSGVTSLVTTSDYFTASSSVITHSPSLSSLSTNATSTSTTYNNSRNSISSTGSSSQIAKSSKVVQPKRESASVLYSENAISTQTSQNSGTPFKAAEVPPPPPPKPMTGILSDNTVRPTQMTCSAMVSNSRSIETSKSHRTSDPEIKAFQKRAVYQFYLKQKQKEKQQDSCLNNGNASTTVSPSASEDCNQVPSRKVHLVVHENIYENSSAQSVSALPLPSPPLPPPPQTTVANVEFVGQDLPLPPPPSAQECNTEHVLNGTHPESHSIDICEQLFVSKGLQTGRSPSPPKAWSPPAPPPKHRAVHQKAEMSTQTTDTLCRNSGGSSLKKVTQENEPSLESNETMNQKPNEVPTKTTTGEQSVDYKSIERAVPVTVGTTADATDDSVVPWAYSKLWPNDKCAKTSHYESDNSHISGTDSPPIGGTDTSTDDTGVELNNEDLLANKSELISRLNAKLDVLRSEEMALVRDIDSNELLGQQLMIELKSLGLTAHESEKINLHLDETEKVTRLLLSISARLQLIETQIKSQLNCNGSESQCIANSIDIESTVKSKVSKNDFQEIRGKQTKQTAYSSTNSSQQQMQSLVSKRSKLLSQLDEALQLRVCIDHRNQLIEDKIVKKYFKNSDESLREFLEFVKLKSKLIVDVREVKDRIESHQKRIFALKSWSDRQS